MTPDEILERSQWDTFWVPPDIQVIDRPELKVLVCSRSVIGYNQVLRLRARDDHHVAELVAEAAGLHVGRTSRFQVTDSWHSAALEARLGEHGYRLEAEHYTYVIDCASYTVRTPPGLVTRRVRTMQQLRDCVEISERAFGFARPMEGAEADRLLLQCTDPHSRTARWVAYDAETDQPIASAGMALHPALGFGLLWAGCTIPEARGRGGYSAVLGARVEEARRLGLHTVGLYAKTDTSAPIVDAQGFTRHGMMRYWARDP